MISIFSPKYAESIITKKLKIKVTMQLLPTGETALTYSTPKEVEQINGLPEGSLDEETYHQSLRALKEKYFGKAPQKEFDDPRAVQERRERAEKAPVEMAPQVTAPPVDVPKEKAETKEIPSEMPLEPEHA